MEKLAEVVKNKEGYSTSELAIILGICTRTIYKLVKQGKLHPVLLGKRHLFLRDDVMNFLKEEQANRKPRKSYTKKSHQNDGSGNDTNHETNR